MQDRTDDMAAELARTRQELAEAREQLGRWQASGVPTYPTTVTPRMAERAAEERNARVRAAIKERQERSARLAKEREERVREAGRERLAAYEGEAHQRHLHNGGSEADWPAVWRELKQRYLAEQAAVDPREQRVQAVSERLRASGRYSL